MNTVLRLMEEVRLISLATKQISSPFVLIKLKHILKASIKIIK